jgi:hypothetical protein
VKKVKKFNPVLNILVFSIMCKIWGRIRIFTYMDRHCFDTNRDPDLDRHQNDADPQHLLYPRLSSVFVSLYFPLLALFPHL